MFLQFSLFTIVVFAANCISGELQNAVKGKKCAKDQVVNKLTVYEDGAIEAECGPLPCGSTASTTCLEEASTCKLPDEVFSGMKWAQNGQSLLLRCCPFRAINQQYIGTDLVTAGSYYTGGTVPEQDQAFPGQQGTVEYDFVANARTEQGGVRIWVNRVVCGVKKAKNGAAQLQQMPPEAGESNDGQPQQKFSDAKTPSEAGAVDPTTAAAEQQQQRADDDESEQAQNPLQYRPPGRSQRRRIRMAGDGGGKY